jgi:copper chaperone CopZ
MTCEGCKASVEQALNSVKGIRKAEVNLEEGNAVLSMDRHIDTFALRQALSSKYTITETENSDQLQQNLDLKPIMDKTKFQQLQPLFLIFGYLLATTALLNYTSWNLEDMMLDFMGLFFIVFSFFKILDLTGFPESFRMYDPLAKLFLPYAWIYPFLEIALGLMFLMRFEIDIALIVTIVILGITSIGVTRSLLDKKSITCACLGTALKLPMTEATFIENAVMIVMALIMIIKNLEI